MAPMSSLATLFLLPTVIFASLDCKNVVAGGKRFNFGDLGGEKDVNWQQDTAPSITNTTFTFNICENIKKRKSDEEEQCPVGTRLCAIQRGYKHGESMGVERVVPIAGEFATSHGGHLDAKFTRLKDSSSNSDAEMEGVRLELHGGISPNKEKQKAIVEMKCDKKWKGNEGFEDNKMMGKMSKREESQDDGSEPVKFPDLDHGKALQFNSYKWEKVGKEDYQVLRLTWKTEHACEDATDSDSSGGKRSSGLGFFGWFFTIVFLLIAAYIIFGSWLNYNRYGARGWDLIPHGDAVRDLPYIVKDWSSSLMDKMKSGGSRGGYSAV